MITPSLLLAALPFGLSLFGIELASSAEILPAVGQPAPDFTLPSQDGSKVSLNQFKGQWVALYFYPKDGTPGCTLEAHNFQKDIAKYQAGDAVVLGVSVDSSDSHRAFCGKQGLSFRLLADTGKQVSAEYGSLHNLLGIKIAARNTFLIDPMGRIAKVWTSVSPAGHSEQVLAALQDLNQKYIELKKKR